MDEEIYDWTLTVQVYRDGKYSTILEEPRQLTVEDAQHLVNTEYINYEPTLNKNEMVRVEIKSPQAPQKPTFIKTNSKWGELL